MKKIAALFLVLCMVLTMAFACAEESTTVSTYMMVYAIDADGNQKSIEDADMTVLVMAIDGASNECAFGTEDAMVTGTYEVVTGDDDVLVLTATLSDGSTVTMFYDVEDDGWMMYNEESGLTMVFLNIETLANEAA